MLELRRGLDFPMKPLGRDVYGKFREKNLDRDESVVALVTCPEDDRHPSAARFPFHHVSRRENAAEMTEKLRFVVQRAGRLGHERQGERAAWSAGKPDWRKFSNRT
jgi:hypothetical protein